MLESEFAAMYARSHRRVLAFVLCRVQPEDAREVVDEVFLIAWRRRDELPDPPLPWLLVTARNLIGERLRREQRDAAVVAELIRCQRRQEEPGVDSAVVERMTVFSALAALRPHEREVLMLTVWDGLSSREAARLLGCSVPTLAVRLHRARRRLAALLKDLDAQPRTTRSPDADVVHIDFREASHE